MDQPLISANTGRRLWVGETKLYHEHLLRRDRFGGAVSDKYIRGYADPPRRGHRFEHAIGAAKCRARDIRYERLMLIDNWR